LDIKCVGDAAVAIPGGGQVGVCDA
jgi:hypothetical protein